MNSLSLNSSVKFSGISFGPYKNWQEYIIDKMNTTLPSLFTQCGIDMASSNIGLGFGSEEHKIRVTVPSEAALFAIKLKLAENPDNFEPLTNGDFRWKRHGFTTKKQVELEFSIAQPPEGFCGGIGNGIY